MSRRHTKIERADEALERAEQNLGTALSLLGGKPRSLTPKVADAKWHTRATIVSLQNRIALARMLITVAKPN